MPKTETTTLHHLVDKRFVGITADGMRVMVDGTRERETKTGMGPMQLVLNALAACMAFDLVVMLEKRRLEVRSYHVEARGERADGPPAKYTHVHTRHVFDVPGLDRRTAERFVGLVIQKYCSVASSLRAEQTFEVELLHERSGAPARPDAATAAPEPEATTT
jgi:putative redox protein